MPIRPRPTVSLDLALALAEVRLLFRLARDADPQAEDAKLQAMGEALARAGADSEDVLEAGQLHAAESPFFPSVYDLMAHIRELRSHRRVMAAPVKAAPLPTENKRDARNWRCNPAEVDELNKLYTSGFSRLRYLPDGRMDTKDFG